jgi:hypothetical protein
MARAFVLQSFRITQSREDFTADDTDGTDRTNEECKMQNEEFLSVKSVKSVVQLLWLRVRHALLIVQNYTSPTHLRPIQ